MVDGLKVDDVAAIDFRRSIGSIGDDVVDRDSAYLCLVRLTDDVDITKLGFLDAKVGPEEAWGISSLLAADVEIVKLMGFFGPDDVFGLTVAEFTVYLVRPGPEAVPRLNFDEVEGPEEVLGRTSDRLLDADGANDDLSLDGPNAKGEPVLLDLVMQEGCEDNTGKGREVPFMGS